MDNAIKQVLLSALVFLPAACGHKGGTVEVEGIVLSQNISADLSLSRARISLKELELEGGTEQDDRDADVENVELELGIANTGTPVLIESADIGTYHTLKLDLSGLLIEGTARGGAFTFTSTIGSEVELVLDPEIDVPASGTAAVAINFNAESWFQGEDGAPLDPADPADRKAIERSILFSMSAELK